MQDPIYTHASDAAYSPGERVIILAGAGDECEAIVINSPDAWIYRVADEDGEILRGCEDHITESLGMLDPDTRAAFLADHGVRS